METPTHDAAAHAFATRYMNRRRLLGGAFAVAGAGTLAGFGFVRTPEIEAQQLTGTSLYDQLGGLVGITTIVTDVAGIIAADERINGFFAETLAAGRAPRLVELVIQQMAEATGGPVRYTGGDMRSVHAGMGITSDAFNAFLEDVALALGKNGVAEEPAIMLLDALRAFEGEIVEVH